MTQSVKAYASYEQLVGGVETLFSNSSDVVKGYAEAAYRTAGLSANQYMETITGFSASLLRSLGDDTEEAARIGNMAVEDMSDNANKMGTSFESIQNAYQGFAKQNYTMLDNLKLGYGGTKEEMGKLLVQAEKFSGIRYDINSYADIVKAIHVIQDEMGITGTTAIEASETIAGSWNSLKSSWTNVLTSIAAGDKEFLDGSIEALTASTGDFVNEITKTVTNIIDSLTKVLPEISAALEPLMPLIFDTLLPAVTDGAVKLMIGLVQGLKDNLPTLYETGKDMIKTLIEGVFGESEELSTVLNAVFGAFDTAVKLATDAITFISDGFNYFLDVISESDIIENTIELFRQIGEKAAGIVDKLSPVASSIKDAFNETIKSVIQGISDAIKFLSDNFETVLAVLVPLTAAFASIKATLAIQGIISAVATALPTLAAALPTLAAAFTAAGGAAGLFKTALTALGGPMGIIIATITFITTGIIYLWNTNEDFRNAVIEIWENIKATVSGAIESITGFFDDLGKAIKELWDTVLPKLQSAFDTVFGAIGNVVKVQFAFINMHINSITSVIKGIVGFLTNAFKGDWKAAWESITGIFTDIFGGVVKFLEAMPGDMLKIGVDIVKGIWNGITSMGDWLNSKVKGFFEGIITGVKNIFGIKSPSKVFEEIFKNNMLGAAQGVDKNGKKVKKSVEQMAKETYEAAKLYIDDYRNSSDYLASEEIKMWETLSKTYTDISKEKIEIDKNMTQLQKAILDERQRKEEEAFAADKKRLELRKFFGTASVQDEVDFWMEMSRKYAEGTEMREEADKSLFESQKRLLNERQQKEEEAFAADKKRLELRKFFGMASVQDEIKFWTEMSERYAEGTKMREEADKSLFESQQRLFSEQEKITDKMASTLADTEFVYAGENTVTGFIDGIRSKFGELKEAISEMAQLTIDGISKPLEINSPSRLFKRFGEFVDKGFIDGLFSKADAVNSAVNKVFGGLGGDISYNLGINQKGFSVPSYASVGAVEATGATAYHPAQNQTSYNFYGDIIIPVKDLEEVKDTRDLFNNLIMRYNAQKG